MDRKVIVKALNHGCDRFTVAIYRSDTGKPSYVSEILDAGDCAFVMVRLADKLRSMGCRYQVQVCERLADVARHTAASMN